MLNALIGLALVYFVLSLIVSAMMEWITQLRGYRGLVLAQVTARLLGLEKAPEKDNKIAANDVDQTAAFHAFFEHPQIQALQQDSTRKPSYVPTGTFAAVFAESVLKMTASEIQNAPALARSKIEQLPEALKTNLLALWQSADGDPQKFLTEIEQWVEQTWDRATGWLRRMINPRLFIVGLLVAAATNADTVRMFQVLTRDTALQQTILQSAVTLAGKGEVKELENALCLENSSSVDCHLKAARSYALDVSPLLGWEEDVKQAHFFTWYLGKLVGLFVTASALLMGAPFWFDMLKKLVSVRQSLRPELSQAEPATDQGSRTPQTQVSTPGGIALPPPKAQEFDFQPHATQFKQENALWLSRFSDLAYSEQALAEAQGREWGYQVSGKFDSLTNNTQYLFAANKDCVILAFRGTEPSQLADWLTDLKAEWVACPWLNGVRIHKGFLDALECEWAHILEQLKVQVPGKALWITGHSLGGALALLATHRLLCNQPDLLVQGLITYGQPRCGDAAFVEDAGRRLAGRCWRSINSRDIVPRVPPYAADFRHCGSVLYLDDLGRLTIDPPLWYRVLDNLDLPTDSETLRREMALRVQDHSISGYSRILANTHVFGGEEKR